MRTIGAVEIEFVGFCGYGEDILINTQFVEYSKTITSKIKCPSQSRVNIAKFVDNASDSWIILLQKDRQRRPSKSTSNDDNLC